MTAKIGNIVGFVEGNPKISISIETAAGKDQGATRSLGNSTAGNQT